MSPFMHSFIGILLGHITWHALLKRHPIMQEEIQSWEEPFRKFFKW